MQFRKPLSQSLEEYLREPPKSLARSAYAVEVNPWVSRGDIEAALFFRGVVVSAVGYVEAHLGELSLRCSQLEVYAALRGSFPYSVSERIKFLKRAFRIEPLAPYEKWALLFFERLESQLELRHMVAHARMQVMPEWGVTFHHYPHSSKEGVTYQTRRIALSELEQLAWRSAKLSRTFQHLYDQLNKTGVLPMAEM